MNYRNSKTSDPHILLLNLSDKINLKRSDKYIALSNCNMYYKYKNIKIINLKNQPQIGMKSLNYLMGHILYQIFKITLNISLKNVEKKLKLLQ